MEYLALAALLICINELREWRTSVHHKKVLEALEFHRKWILQFEHTIIEMEKKQRGTDELLSVQMGMISELQLLIEKHHAATNISHEFIKHASVDLATIVNEYKINGVPLGFQRKPHIDPYDLVEGL